MQRIWSRAGSLASCELSRAMPGSASCSHLCSGGDALQLGRHRGLSVQRSPDLSCVLWSSWGFAPLLIWVTWTLELPDLYSRSCFFLVSIYSTGTPLSPVGPFTYLLQNRHSEKPRNAVWQNSLRRGGKAEKQGGFVLAVTSKHPKQWFSPALHCVFVVVKWANNIDLLMKFLQETFKSSDIQKLFCYKRAGKNALTRWQFPPLS